MRAALFGQMSLTLTHGSSDRNHLFIAVTWDIDSFIMLDGIMVRLILSTLMIYKNPLNGLSK